MIERCPFAVWRAGPVHKQGYDGVPDSMPKRGEVKHSAEGGWAGVYSVLDGPRRASWQFTVGYDRIEQHYDVSANCWHAGDADSDDGVAANIELDGVEHLGFAGEPLTPYQEDATARLTRWLSETNGRIEIVRFPRLGAGLWTLAEHNEVSDDPTACPSTRIDWPRIIALVNGVHMPDQDDINREFFNQLGALGAENQRTIETVREVARFTLAHTQDLSIHDVLTPTETSELAATIESIGTRLDELNEKLRGAAAVLGGP